MSTDADKLTFAHEFYATRWRRLRDLIHDNALHIEEEACAIMANGTPTPNDPPTYDQLMNALRYERDNALEEFAEQKAETDAQRANWLENAEYLELVDSLLDGIVPSRTEGGENIWLKERVEMLVEKAQGAFEDGIIRGLRMYAWWKDGTEYVGTCGTTLRDAIAKVKGERVEERPCTK